MQISFDFTPPKNGTNEELYRWAVNLSETLKQSIDILIKEIDKKGSGNNV